MVMVVYVGDGGGGVGGKTFVFYLVSDAYKSRYFRWTSICVCVPAAMTHLTIVYWLFSHKHAGSFITTYKTGSISFKNINHVRHLIFNFWGQLPISVEFQPKPDNIRVAVLKCKINKLETLRYVTCFRPFRRLNFSLPYTLPTYHQRLWKYPDRLNPKRTVMKRPKLTPASITNKYIKNILLQPENLKLMLDSKWRCWYIFTPLITCEWNKGYAWV